MCVSYSTIVLYGRDDHGWWVWSAKKQPKLTFRNHSQPLYSIGQAQTSPNVSSVQSKVLQTNFYKIFKIFYFSKFLLPYSLTHSLMHSVKHSRKLATVTASLLWRKCFEFHDKKNPFHLKCLHACTVVLQF